MSQNKKPQPQKAEEAKAENAGMKKSTKVIIIAAVAIVLVAAVLVGIFVVKPAVEKNKEPSTEEITYSVAEKNENENYEYVTYRGARMAKDLADIIIQAEKDSQADIKANGAALEVGDYEISKGEFALYYYDQHSIKKGEVEYSIELRGQNLTGYEPTMTPMSQQYPGEDYTWADKFASDSVNTLKDIYVTFDKAIDSGVTLTEVEIKGLIDSYTRVERFAQANSETADELVSRIYGSGVTYAMFAKREIMQTYAAKCEETEAEKLYNAVTEKELQEYFDKDPSLYASMNVRVYPVQGEYDAVEISRVNTEEEFLEFAKKNYPHGEYNAEVLTQAFHVTKERLSATFGPEVGEWAFDKSRVTGEVALITGQLYEYLVYIDSLPVYEYSHDVLVFNQLLEGGETAEEMDKLYEQVEEFYNKVKGKETTPEEFKTVFADTNYGWYETAARGDDFYFEVANWILDPARKKGDMEMFADSQDGIFVIYYLEPNPEDLDWKHYVRTILSDERYVEEYDALAEDYKIKEDSAVIKKVMTETDAKIKKSNEEAKKAQNQQ